MAGLSAEGAVRAAMAALGTVGSAIALRLPVQAVSGNDGEQLGLITPQFEDVVLMPAAWRKAGTTEEMLIGAASVTELVSSRAFASAQSLFESAAGIVAGEVLYTITDSQPLEVGGTPCAYRLTLEAPPRA